jgi:N-acetyl-anhydromuramyl-L-alanine amidase AmpD
MKGYSDYEKSIGKSIADSVYNYDKSYDQRYNSKPKNYVEVTPQKPKSLELKGITSNSFNDSFRQPKSQPVINDPFGRLNRMKPGVMKKEEPKGWLDYASDIYDNVAETVLDASNNASEYFDLGVNWLERQYNKNSDAIEESSFIKEPIITNSEYNINRPVITGDTLKINDEQYYLPEVMDLNEFTFKSRNRNEITPIETEAASITAFNPFENYETVKGLNFPKNSNFIGIDNKGNFKSGTIDQFSPSDKLSRVFKNNVESFATDDKGKMKFVRWSDNIMVDGKRVGNKDNPKSYVPLVNVIDDNGKKTVGTLNLLTKSPDDSGTFGQITGGRLVLKQGDKQILVSGSINDVKNQFDKLAKNGPVEVFTLDNGSYSRGFRTYNQKITEDQLRKYDLQNVSGGHFLYSTGEKPRNKYTESRYQTPNVRTKSDESYLQGHPLKNELQGVVLHQTAYKDKDLSGVHNQFMTPNKNSAHVLIGYDGERRVYADPEQVTFHGGKSSFKGRPNVNDFMLGLEFQGVAGEDRLTNAQIESAIEYLTPIIRKYNIPIEHITSHGAVAPGRKHDVSDADLEKIYKIIRDRLYTKKRNGGSVGINQLDAQPMKKLNQLLNFTNNPDKDNWLDKYN